MVKRLCKGSAFMQSQIYSLFWVLRTELSPATGGSATQGWEPSFRAWGPPSPKYIAIFLERFWAIHKVFLSVSVYKGNHSDCSLQSTPLTCRILPETSGNVCQRHYCEFTKSKSSFFSLPFSVLFVGRWGHVSDFGQWNIDKSNLCRF